MSAGEKGFMQTAIGQELVRYQGRPHGTGNSKGASTTVWRAVEVQDVWFCWP